MFGVWSVRDNDRLASAISEKYSGASFDRFFCTIGSEQKFPGDCLCVENDRYVLYCEGCILNSTQLIEQSGGTLSDVIVELFERGTDTICRTLKGAYAIAVFDRLTERLTVTNDLLSKLQLFYYSDGDCLIWSTSFLEVCDFVRLIGGALTVDSGAVSMMLSRRYMFEDYTYAREIRYLDAFRVLTNADGNMQAIGLPVPETERRISTDEACTQLDRLFMNACRLQFEKNAANGYSQVASLSGGMDSKAVFLSGIRAGYSIDRAFTYAEPGSLDETIPQTIAADHGVPHLFHSIARGTFIKNRDELIRGGEGHIYYAGTTGLCGMAASMRTDDVGIVHAGIGGGEIMGDINRVISDENAHRESFRSFADSVCSDSADADALFEKLTARYADYNAFANISDLRQCINMIRTSQGWFIPFSPFLDEDFFCYAMSIPVAMRKDRALYCQWCTEHMSNPYATTSDFVTSKEVRQSGVKLRRLYHRITRKIGAIAGIKSRRDMNPFSHWEKSDPGLRTAMDEMLSADLEAIGTNEMSLTSRLRSEYSSGGILERLSVLTITWVLVRMLKKLN